MLEHDPFAVPLRVRLHVALYNVYDYLVALLRVGGKWWLIERCPMCERFSVDVVGRTLNTAYTDNERNYQTSCVQCWQTTIEYFEERWEEYYSNCF